MAPVKRKGFTAKQSRRTSRKMESSQIGTHYVRSAPRARQQRNQVGFSMQAQRVSTAKRIALLVAIVVVLALIGFGVGSTVFFATSSSRLSLGSDDVSSALVSPEEGEPYYALLAADLDSSDDADGFSADALVLAYVDAGNGSTALVSVPSNATVSLSDGDAHPLSEAVAVGGDDELVSAVSSLTDVDIAHYARTDANGIVDIADYLGGVTVNVTEEVDDPAAGRDVLYTGEQSLTGSQALTFLRSSNFSEGAVTQGRNQCAFVAAVAQQLLAQSGPSQIAALDAVAGSVRCDLDANAAISLVSPLAGYDASSVVIARVPGYVSADGDVQSFIVSSASWDEMRESIEAGGDPSADDPAVAAVNPGSFSITVRNGSGVTGGASELADTLTAAGFNVTETGNANSYVYTETLVVYQDDDFADEAEAVVSALGFGRAIPSAGFYTFETDILVVLGTDFAPTS